MQLTHPPARTPVHTTSNKGTEPPKSSSQHVPSTSREQRAQSSYQGLKTNARSKGSTGENPYNKPISRKYFRCSQPGHRPNECPARKSVNIVDGDDSTKENDVEPKEESEFVKGDEGDPMNCVVQWLLLAPNMRITRIGTSSLRPPTPLIRKSAT